MGSRERHDPKRGRHKSRRSPETTRFEQLTAPPPAPGYLEPATYNALLRLRHRLELDVDDAP